MEIVEIAAEKGAVCDRILRALPDWFGIEQAIVDYVAGVAGLPMLGCRIEGEVAGFLSLKPHNEATVEIYVLGVLPDRHRRGIGRALVEAADRHAGARGFRFLTVKTVSPTVDHEPYERTRRFYRALGFLPVEDMPNPCSPDNPLLLLIRPVTS